MLVDRLRRCANIKPTQGQRVVIAVNIHTAKYVSELNASLTMGQH